MVGGMVDQELFEVAREDQDLNETAFDEREDGNQVSLLSVPPEELVDR